MVVVVVVGTPKGETEGLVGAEKLNNAAFSVRFVCGITPNGDGFTSLEPVVVVLGDTQADVDGFVPVNGHVGGVEVPAAAGAGAGAVVAVDVAVVVADAGEEAGTAKKFGMVLV